MAQKELLSGLRSFKKEISKSMPVTRMILFGSRAWGKPNRDSDVDIIVVSPKFKRERSLDRGVGLYKYWELEYPVDFLCYTPEEFKKLRLGATLVREAAKKGIEIK